MKLRFALIGVAASAAVRSCGAPPPVVQAQADTFRESVGINTHLGYDGTPYSNPARALAALRLLGITRVRDSALREGERTLPAYAFVARGGVKLDLFFNRSIDVQLSRVERLLTLAPKALLALEGPNEANHEPFGAGSASGPEAAQGYQAQLYKRAHARPRLAQLPIYNLTYWPPLYGRADAANFHAYPGSRSISRVLSWQRRLAAAVQPRGSAIVCTETGFTTGGRDAVSEQRQAELEVVLLLQNFRAGVKETFLYELYDEGGGAATSASDREAHWGLFHYDGGPKPAALAVARLMQVLTPAANTVRSSTTDPLALSGAGMLILRLRRSDGVWVTLVWRNDPLADATPVTVATTASGVQMMNLATGQARQLTVGRTSLVLSASPLAFIQAQEARGT